jgi:hypothetical protein
MDAGPRGGQGVAMGTTSPSSGSGPPPPDPYGAFAKADGLGGVAAPLLAGFAITLMALVVQSASDLRWADVSLLLLGAAAVLLLQVVQLNARARGYAVTPAQAREWYPQLDEDSQRARVIDWELQHHLSCWQDLVRRARIRYNLAVILLLCAIAVLLVPENTAEFTATRWLAVLVVALGAATEVAAVLAGWGRAHPHSPTGRVLSGALGWVTPQDPPIPRPPFPTAQPASSGPVPVQGEESPAGSGDVCGSGPFHSPV